MAKTLCSADLKSGSGATRYPLVSDGANLLVMSKSSNWASKELVVTPKDERYFMAATYGKSSSYSATASGNFADGIEMSNRLSSLMTKATVNSWKTGHKPMYHYVARSCGPWMIKTKSQISTDDYLRCLEYGACWNARKFCLYGLPVGKASSFSAKIRVYNGSVVNTGVAPQWAVPVYLPMEKGSHFFNYQYNNAGNLRYNFSKELCPPSQYVASGYGEIDIAAHANNNCSSSTGWINYDIYNAHVGTASQPNLYSAEYQNTRIYAKSGNDKSEYYYDYEITGDGLTAFRNAIKNGSFWMYTGYKMADICSQNGVIAAMDPFHTMLNYASRIELVLTVSMSRFNYS